MTSFPLAARAAVTLAMVVGFCFPAPPQEQTKSAAPVGHSTGKRLKLPGVRNFAEVTPLLYRGGQPTREGFENLARRGIEIVVDGRLTGKETERKVVTGLGMQYVAIPWHCLFPKDSKFAQFLAVLRDNPKKKVFVHCRYGDDRTGMMIAAYRMAIEHWTPEEAREEMDQFGFENTVCFPLKSYEKNFPERLKTDPALRGLVPVVVGH